jgi:hypothetical protein
LLRLQKTPHVAYHLALQLALLDLVSNRQQVWLVQEERQVQQNRQEGQTASPLLVLVAE